MNKRTASLILVVLLIGSLTLGQDRKLLLGAGGPLSGGGGGISDFASDSFTEGSDATLASHVPEVGGGWAAHDDTVSYPSTITIDAASDRIFQIDTAAYYITNATPCSNYYTQATLHVISVTSTNASVAARMNTSTNTMYVLRFLNGSSFELRSIVSGTPTTLGSTTDQVPGVGQSAVLRLEVNNDQISGYINDVLELGPFTDSSITAAGKPGIRLAGPITPTTGYHLDNFSARCL